jgi:DNA helicase-2/ATP-dependent DNA helicase PcrA
MMADDLGQSRLTFRQVADAPSGRTIVLGQAGSGKTTLIVERAARLLAAGVGRERILLLAPTPGAARSLATAATRAMPMPPATLTFHELASGIVQRDHQSLGLRQPPAPMSSFELFQALRLALADDGVEHWPSLSGSAPGDSRLVRDLAHDLLLGSLENGLTSDELRQRARAWGRSDLADIAGFVGRFIATIRRRAALPRSELLVLAIRLLTERPTVAAHWQRRYGHVLVDESEDASWAQTELLCRLVSADTDLLIAGDPASGINAYAGGDPSYLLGLPDRLDATVVRLEAPCAQPAR